MYDSRYYQGFRSGSQASAREVVPLIMDWFTPESVIDLGCGMADWLAAFQESGVHDVIGVDGEHVDPNQLAIRPQEFIVHDLTSPFDAGRKFDLAMSLEVAEHLPEPSAPVFVESLTGLAPFVLFSAAIPTQPGERHINCQWPAYWAELFAKQKYVGFDVLRMRLWENSRIDWWYRQNMAVYVAEDHLDRLPEWMRSGAGVPAPLVHPEMLLEQHRDLVNWGAEWERKYWRLAELHPEAQG